MKLLLLGSFNKGALEHYYVEGLQSQNVEIDCFDIAGPYFEKIGRSVYSKIVNKFYPSVYYSNTNKTLLEYCRGKEFDVILVFKGLVLYPDTIAQLKKHTKLVCCYNPDHPFLFYSAGSGNSNIEKSIHLYDIYFSYAATIVEELKKRYNVNSFRIPFGFDNSKVNLPVPGEAFIQKWLFAGAYDKERASFLSKLKSNELVIYGEKKWLSRNKGDAYLRKAYQRKSLYNDEYKTGIKNALGVINILRKQNIVEESHNMRTFEVPGYGGLLIANRTKEQISFFEEDKEAIYFDTIEELQDKLNFYFQHQSAVQQIKEKAFQRAMHSGYTYKDRSKELYNILLAHL